MSKAGRPKKGSAGLPEWFDIKKYRDAKDFRAIDWYEQLLIRFLLRGHFEHDEPNEAMDKHWFKMLDLLKTNPIITQKHIAAAETQRIEIKGHKLIKLNDVFQAMSMIFSTQASGIKDATNRNIFEAYERFPDDVRDYLTGDLENAGWCGSIIQKPGSSPAEPGRVYDFLNKQYDYNEQTLTSIDLFLPDEILFAEFKEYVLNKRKKYPRPNTPFFKNPDFKSWYNTGILPYIDLMLLDTPNVASIRWSAFGDALDAIVDVSVGGDSALAKANKTLASKLMNIDTIRILQTQAAREKSGMMQKSGKLIVR